MMKKKSEDGVLIPAEFEPKNKKKYYYGTEFGAVLSFAGLIWVVISSFRLIMGYDHNLEQFLFGLFVVIGGAVIGIVCDGANSYETFINYIRYLQKSNKLLESDNKKLREKIDQDIVLHSGTGKD